MVTLVGVCGDPHYISCTNPAGEHFMEMGSECSCWFYWGMSLGQSSSIEVFRVHECRAL